MNFYATDTFLDILAKVYFTGQKTEKTLFSHGENVFRLLEVNGEPLVQWPFLDFTEPLDRSEVPVPPTRKVEWLPLAIRGLHTAEDWLKSTEIRPEGIEPSPTIFWSGFESWEAFEAHCKKRRSNIFSDARRRRKKMEAELGPLTFTWHDPSDEAFALGAQWKSRQYKTTGVQDMLAQPDHRKLFETLRQDGHLIISTLKAGDRICASHWGVLHEGRFFWWMPSYDDSLAAHSPGRTLQGMLMEECFRQKHLEFDFMIGDEAYKWFYATHVREVGPLGIPPLSLRMRRKAKGLLKTLAQKSGMFEQLKALRRKIRGH